jgi:hypothetical protein
MKKFTTLLGAAALVTIMPATPAAAEGAAVIQDGFCGGFIPTADGGTGQLISGEVHSVTTKKGNTSVVCHFEFEAGLIPKAYHASGFACGTFAGLTTNSRMVANPDGFATLTCKINANKN